MGATCIYRFKGHVLKYDHVFLGSFVVSCDVSLCWTDVFFFLKLWATSHFFKLSTPDACLVMTLRRHVTWHTDRTAGCRAGKIHPTSIRCQITFWQFLQGVQYVLLRRRQPHSGHLCRIEDDEKRQGKWWSIDYGWGDLIKYLVCEKKRLVKTQGECSSAETCHGV